jgi:cytochrome b561
LRNKSTTYSFVDRANHWVVAVAVIGLLAAGWILFLGFLDRETAGNLRDMHKAIGVCVLAFGIWRVGYRLLKGFPESVGGVATWQAMSARVAHYILLAGILIMPVSGLARGHFAGRGTDMFGLFTIPGATVENETLSELGSAVHFTAGLLVTLVLVLHILAALKHHFIDRDATLVRMLSGATFRGRK